MKKVDTNNKSNIDILKDINIVDLSKNSLAILEEAVKFIPRKSEMFKSMIKEILVKKHKTK